MKLYIYQPGKKAEEFDAPDGTNVIINDQRDNHGKYHIRLEYPAPVIVRPEWPEDRSEALNAFYGTPDFARGRAPEQTYIIPPYPMYLAWSPDTRLLRMRCHKKVAASLKRILESIAKTYSPDEIRRHGLDQFGGTSNVRMMRNGRSASRHSWGIAIDLDPIRNGLITPAHRSYIFQHCPEVVRIFDDEGWSAGGRMWGRDCMHFQATQQPIGYHDD